MLFGFSKRGVVSRLVDGHDRDQAVGGALEQGNLGIIKIVPNGAQVKTGDSKYPVAKSSLFSVCNVRRQIWEHSFQQSGSSAKLCCISRWSEVAL